MTGTEILEMIKKKDREYITSTKSEEKQPNIILSTHECFKLAACLGHSSMYFNRISALASGELSYFNFESVRISRQSEKKTEEYCKCKRPLQGILGHMSKLYLCRNCGLPIKEK